MLKKIIKGIKTICIYISIITLPGIYILLYLYPYNEENKKESLILVTLIIISHIVTAKELYDMHNKKGD